MDAEFEFGAMIANAIRKGSEREGLRRWALYHRALNAGIEESNAVALVEGLEWEDQFVSIIELIERGCPLTTAIRIVV